MSTRNLVLAGTLLIAACGGDSAPSGGLTVHFQLSKGGLKDCKDVREVRAVSVKVLGADGVTALPGWPKTADCGTGVFTDSTVPAGSYTIEVIATGDLFDDPKATLFKVRREITLPGDSNITIALAPEVAFLAVSWTFSTTGDLSPCTDEIDTVSIFLGSGAAGAGTFTETDLPCAMGTYAIPTPLLAQNYTVKLDAYAKNTGRKIYDVDEQRLLERGDNPTFAVVFEPVGGRLLFDWQFAILGTAPITACDDARVGVSSVVAQITTNAGDDPIDVEIPCAAQRPFAVPGARFTEGKQLYVTLTAEGVQRFRGTRPIITHAGDTDLGLIPLAAVGSATVTVTRTATTACPAQISGISVLVTPVSGRAPTVMTTIDAMGGTVPVLDVPLDEYDVVAEGLVNGVSACRVARREIISGRANRWRPIEL